MTQAEILKGSREKMEKSIESLRFELAKVRTGRASLGLLDGVRVEYYGSEVPLNQVATLAVPESRLITIQPWDPKMIAPIEKAVRKAELGLTPTNDGHLLRIVIPPLNEERRKELIRLVHRMTEDARVALRNFRRDANDHLKEIEKTKEIAEDELHRVQREIQKLTDEFMAKADAILGKKEQELSEV